MSEHNDQVASMYREFVKSPVYAHLKEACDDMATSTRKNASSSKDTAYGELRFADGIEWVFDAHINQQKVLDKKGVRER